MREEGRKDICPAALKQKKEDFANKTERKARERSKTVPAWNTKDEIWGRFDRWAVSLAN